MKNIKMNNSKIASLNFDLNTSKFTKKITQVRIRIKKKMSI